MRNLILAITGFALGVSVAVVLAGRVEAPAAASPGSPEGATSA